MLVNIISKIANKTKLTNIFLHLYVVRLSHTYTITIPFLCNTRIWISERECEGTTYASLTTTKTVAQIIYWFIHRDVAASYQKRQHISFFVFRLKPPFCWYILGRLFSFNTASVYDGYTYQTSMYSLKLTMKKNSHLQQVRRVFFSFLLSNYE